jgi:hypothetical protein
MWVHLCVHCLTISEMKLEYMALVLMMLGATKAGLFSTKADTYATFAKGRSLPVLIMQQSDWWIGYECKDLYKEKYNVDDYGCRKDVPGSKTIDFLEVQENTTVCLLRYSDEHCNDQPYPQNLTLVPDGDSKSGSYNDTGSVADPSQSVLASPLREATPASGNLTKLPLWVF